MKRSLYFAMALAMISCGSQEHHGIDRANLDESAAPGADFYQYACGGWMKSHPLPDEYSRYGTFDRLGEDNLQQLKDLIEGLNPNAPAGSNEQKVATLYAQGMDSVKLNADGAKPILGDIAKINAASRDQILHIVASTPGSSAFFSYYVDADMKNSNVNTLYWFQGGLNLGDRDYYLEDEPQTIAVREAYKTFLATIASLIGYDEAAQQRLVDNTMAIETQLAKAAMTREELRDPAASYNPATIADLDKQYPALALKAFFTTKGIANADTIIIGQPASLAAVNDIIVNAPEQAIRDYVVAEYAASAAPFLSDDFINAQFELSKVISGAKEQKPRWKRALSVPNDVLGEALGELYVAKYFPASSKEKMLDLVKNLQTALSQHIDALTWMSDTTKTRAQEKLAAFTVKIGYPDKWRDYSALTIDPKQSYWHNMQVASLFEEQYRYKDYGKPVDRSRWEMSPQTVNAYYNPLANEIVFPAGILQPPFFDPEADDACNYGAIGVVIGHEMTHGFDDQGRQFDKNGNLTDWWTPADAEAFNALADKLVAQFDQVIVLGDTHANGRFTLGENIADQGGLRVAYTAFCNSQQGKTPADIDGFTPDQRFYLAYANVWAGNIRDEEILSRTKTDPHSLGRWRVNASLRNIQSFFDAFGIHDGDAMWRPEADRVIIW